MSKNNSWLYNHSNKSDAVKKNRKKKRKDRKEERKDNWTWGMVILNNLENPILQSQKTNYNY